MKYMIEIFSIYPRYVLKFNKVPITQKTIFTNFSINILIEITAFKYKTHHMTNVKINVHDTNLEISND